MPCSAPSIAAFHLSATVSVCLCGCECCVLQLMTNLPGTVESHSHCLSSSLAIPASSCRNSRFGFALQRRIHQARAACAINLKVWKIGKQIKYGPDKATNNNNSKQQQQTTATTNNRTTITIAWRITTCRILYTKFE